MNWPALHPAEAVRAIAQGRLPARAEREDVSERIVAYLQALPIDDALSLATAAAGWESPVEGLDYRIDKGLLVFTAWYHLRRGYCCGNGCRHCPYPDTHK